MNKTKINAIIVDDHELFRDGLKILLEQDNIVSIIGEASNGREFLQLLSSLSPDLVLMDIDMPVLNGIEASEMALALNPNLNILVLSMYNDYSHYSQLVSAGVKGFISKSCGKQELEKGILAVGNGGYYFSGELFRDIILKIGKTQDQTEAELVDKVKFTSRELEVLTLICNGFSRNEIADKLFLSSKTIDNIRLKLLQKADVKNSVSLVIYAIKNKIVTL